MNHEQFEQVLAMLVRKGFDSTADQLRARDTAQREALAQLQPEMPDLRANMTKALDLLQVLTSTKYTDRAFVEAVDEADEMLEQLRGKVVLKGLAEQQEARPVSFYDAIKNPPRIAPTLQQEARRAQAGDERAAFEHEVRRQTEGLRFHPEFHRLDDTGLYEDATLEWSWVLWQARAALATQPEAGQFAAAAAFVRKMATDYANEHGWDDMGGLSFGAGPQGTAKMEHFLFLEELAEKLRTMTTEGGAGHV